MRRTHFVHKFETGKILDLPRSDKVRPQRPYAVGVASGGVGPFFRRRSSPSTARPSVARLTPGPPPAVSQTHNSASVASGCWLTQAIGWARAWASRYGAGPLRWGSAASELRVRWRCKSVATNETDTLSWAATAPTVRPGWSQATATRSRKSRE